MEIKNRSKGKAELKGNRIEILSLIKVIKFVLKELEYEYFTRTGFYENETEFLIETIKSLISEDEKIQRIEISNEQIFNLRQNLAEVLFAIPINSYDGLFKISKEKLNSLFKSIDKYGKDYKIWA